MFKKETRIYSLVIGKNDEDVNIIDDIVDECREFDYDRIIIHQDILKRLSTNSGHIEAVLKSEFKRKIPVFVQVSAADNIK